MDEYQMEFATGFGESYQNCPACGKEMVAGHSECFSCGVVVQKFEDRTKLNSTKQAIGGIDHLTDLDIKKLDKKWKQVVVNYNDQDEHQNFIKVCQENGALPFAVHHYSRMLEIDREDDIAEVMRKQALSRLTIQALPAPSNETAIKELPIDFITKTILWGALFVSLSLILVGFFNPAARNLIGLGFSFMLMFIALLLYRRP
jgi:ribosomal protein S27AE